MAYTKIKNIKTTINKAIEYITNPAKTNNEKFIYGYNVTPKTAHIEFSFTEKMAQNIKGDYKREKGNVAYHIIQSFDYKDILTPEEALEIGKKTVEQFTEGKYEYVIATHIDKTCIHNHIIFNAISFVDYKRFNSKPYKTVARLHSISDSICAENGLTVLKAQKNDSKSYYEWLMDKQGLSWKRTLKNIIDKNIVNAKSFDEFIELMRKDDYEIKQGKYLAFKHKGQDRYIRCYKLGKSYSEEVIKDRINNKNKYKFIFNNETVSKRPLPLNVLVKLKARKQAITNIKEIAELLLKLEKDYNITTKQDIKTEKGLSSIKYNNIKTEIKSIENKIKYLQEEQRNILIYLKYKNINDSYKKSFNKKSFYNKHESELILFESAEKSIKKLDIENIEFLRDNNEENIKKLQKEYVELNKNLKQEKDKIEIIEKLENKLNKISEKEKEQQQEQTKKKKKDILL